MKKLLGIVLLLLVLGGCAFEMQAYEGKVLQQKIELIPSDKSLGEIEASLLVMDPSMKLTRRLENALFLVSDGYIVSVTENDLNDLGKYIIEFDRK